MATSHPPGKCISTSTSSSWRMAGMCRYRPTSARDLVEFYSSFLPGKREQQEERKTKLGTPFSRQIGEVKKEMKRQWEAGKKQLHEPGKMHRLERLAVAQLPYHPQYMDPGTGFNADLRRPLDFGAEPLTSALLEHIGTTPPSAAWFMQYLSRRSVRCTARRGSRGSGYYANRWSSPITWSFPEGSRLEGSVLQARPARRFSRNGQLRIVFHQVVPPAGQEKKWKPVSKA